MTSSMVEALKQLPENSGTNQPDHDGLTTEPSLNNPTEGNPIAHSQVVDLWRTCKSSGASVPNSSLEELLRGSRVYIAPKAPKPEPTAEYKALMARLRRDEEALSYHRMVNPAAAATRETFNQRFPYSSTQAFASVNQPVSKDDFGDDDVTYNDVHRQFMLILNFVVSILGVAGTLWVTARWWSVPARLFLTMGGSALVAVAEVSVYSIYVWKMGDAKKKQETVKEVQEVVSTWVVGKDEDKNAADQNEDDAILLKEKKAQDTEAVRKRLATSKENNT